MNHLGQLRSLFEWLISMGPRYLLFRAWHELSRRSGLLKRRFPVSAASLEFPSLSQWRKQPTPFFWDTRPSFSTPLDPASLAALRSRVERIHANQYLFFSAKWYSVPDWHTHPLTGHTYDATAHWTQVPDFSTETGDIKYIWEKGRFTFLYDLIRYDAHSQTDLSELVLSRIEAWIEANPVNRGPHWRCSQEITLRVLNWTFALHYYRDSPALTEARWQRILNSIYRQMQHVEAHIHFSRIAVRNNHALTETLGLYLIGLLYPFFPESDRWKRRGKKWFETEVAYQIYDDGTFLQFSMNYHRVVVQLLVWAIALAHRNGAQWSEAVYDRARKSLHFLQSCQDIHTGHLPNYGSNDGALFFPLTECQYRDYRPQLAALAGLLDKPVPYTPGTWQEELYWFGLAQAIPALNPSERVGPHAFTKGGYYTLTDKDQSLTFIRCGAYKDRPAQADNLHLDIWVGGQNLLHDAGSYRYNTDPKWVHYFMGTASHNTVQLGDLDQMQKGSRFIWYNWIREAEGEWHETPDHYQFEGSFVGYRSLGSRITHRRRITKSRHKLEWLVEDTLEGAPDDLPMNQLWHLSDSFFKLARIEAFSADETPIPPVHTEGWYSSFYGVKTPCKRLVFTAKDHSIRTKITVVGSPQAN